MTVQEKKDALVSDDIGIVSMACRFPGNSNDPDQFNTFLNSSQDARNRIPLERWDVETAYPEDFGDDVCYIHDVSDVSLFDAQLFNISATEASAMDPQQRLILTVAYEALYRSNIRGPGVSKDINGIKRFAGANVGVFVALCNYDWTYLRQEDPEGHGSHTCAGAFSSIASGRVSYTFDLKGPSVVYDTGCSSSHVALDAAFKALRDGDCDSALVIGCSLNLHPETYTKLQRAGQLSPTGRCHSFDARADGYARGEGCGAVILRRIPDAVTEDESVLAIVKSVAVSQDGKRHSISATSGPAQEGVIKRGLKKAGLKPSDIDYVEAHGSGTAQGDANEVNSLRAVFGGVRESPLVIGAVKSAVGHLEAAAGIAGLIKAVMALKTHTVPPNRHLRNLNPAISVDGFNVHFPQTAYQFGLSQASDETYAGVSSFGMSGTICFAVLQKSPFSIRKGSIVDKPPSVSPKYFPWKKPLSYRQRCKAQSQNSASTANTEEVVDKMCKFTKEINWIPFDIGTSSQSTDLGTTLFLDLENFNEKFDSLKSMLDTESLLTVVFNLINCKEPYQAFERMIRLAQVLTNSSERRVGKTTTLIICTSGSTGPIVSEAKNLTKEAAELAGIWGFAKATRNDLLWLRVKCVDSYPPIEPSIAMIKELKCIEKENDIAIRDSKFYLPRLQNAIIKKTAPPSSVERCGTYIVSGGLGGLGLALAEWLVEFGAARIILLSRSGKQKETAATREKEKLRMLHEQTAAKGYSLELRKCDVTSPSTVQQLFKEIGDIKGVFHAAGLLNEDPIESMTLEKFRKVYDCKARGVWSLHDATKSLKKLKYFIVFSSSAAVLGIPKFVHYCAGNASLDACITFRRQTNLPGMAIQLSGVSSAGMSFRSMEHQKRTGIFDLQPLEDLRKDFLNIMQGGHQNESIFIGLGNWKRYQTIVDNGYSNTVLSPLHGESAEMPMVEEESNLSKELSSILAAPESDRKTMIKTIVDTVVAGVTVSGESVEDDEPLLDAGVDSLAAIELGILLSKKLPELKPPAMPLPAVLVFELPTVNKIVEHIHEIIKDFKPVAVDRSADSSSVSPEMRILLDMGPEDRVAGVRKVVQDSVAMVTVSGEHVDDDEPLLDAGVDSLAAIELGITLKKKLPELKPPGMPLPAVLVFELPTVNKIVSHICNLLKDFTPVPSRPLRTVNPSCFQPCSMQVQGAAGANTNEPIAIIGMACRYPGVDDNDLRTPSELWNFVLNENVASSRVPKERCWTEDDQFGCFLHDVDAFDSKFFGISPAEAKTMDPQHRLLLEVGYEALFTCGYDKKRLAGMNVGCFVGIQGNAEYAEASGSYRKSSGPYAVSGCLSSYSAGRVSYCLDLTGPCMAIDDACASGLVAAHTAVRSIQGGECEMALVEGVSLMFHEKVNLDNLRAGLLSKSGCVCSFDESATGYHRGEGCGAVVLKKLSAAKRDGDTVLGIIKGSAVKHNGRTASLMAPSISAQKRLLTEALKSANMSPNEVDYLEAHGTATALGDPVEASAIAAVYGAPRVNSQKRPLFVGSMKANFGHMEAAGSIAGLIKSILVLHHKIVPANAHLDELNLHIQEIVDGLPVSFPMKNERINLRNKKKSDSNPLGAAVSAFGACGTITHLLLQEAPESTDKGNSLNYLRNPVNYTRTKFEMELGYSRKVCEVEPVLRRASSFSDIILESLCDVIGIESMPKLGDNTLLVESGLIDSLGAIELRNRVVDALTANGAVDAATLPPAQSLFVKYKTLEDLIEYCSSVFKLNNPQVERESVTVQAVQDCVSQVLTGDCGVSESLVDAGMDSLAAIELRNNLLDMLEKSGVSNIDSVPSPTILFAKYPTISALVNYCEESFGSINGIQKISSDIPKSGRSNVDINESVSVLNDKETDLKLCMLHGIDGDVSSLTEVAKSLPYRTYGVSLSEAVKARSSSLNELASNYIESLHECLSGNFADLVLVGYSFGAIIAYEMTLVLQRKGIAIKGLVIADMQVSWPFVAWGDELKSGRFMSQEIAARKFAGDDWDKKYASEFAEIADPELYAAKAMMYFMPNAMRKSDWVRLLKGWETNIDYLIKVTGVHSPGVSYCGQTLFIRSASPEFETCVKENEKFCGTSMKVKYVSGTHFTMMESSHALETCEAIVSFCHQVSDQSGNLRPKTGLQVQKKKEKGNDRKVCFMFTGQGSQYKDMGRELYEKDPTFRFWMLRCNEILSSVLSVSLLDILYGEDEHLINDTRYTQPAIFSVEYSLAMLWKEKGLLPDIVMGHSVGEYVAATIAGVLTLEDGLKLISARGEAIFKCDPMNGVMVAVRASSGVLQEALLKAKRNTVEDISNLIAIASINGPKSCVLAGEKDVVDRVLEFLPKGVGFVPLQVSHAYHSPLIKDSLEFFRHSLKSASFNKPCIPIVSNLTGKFIDAEIRTAEHWEKHVLGCVDFAKGVEFLLSNSIDVFVEIGAHPTLSSMGRQIALAKLGKNITSNQLWLSSMQKSRSSFDVLGRSEDILKEKGLLSLEKLEIPPKATTDVIVPDHNSGGTDSDEKRLERLVSSLLGCDFGKSDDLKQLGLDSLTAIELKEMLSSSFDFQLDDMLLFSDSLTFDQLTDAVLGRTEREECTSQGSKELSLFHLVDNLLDSKISKDDDLKQHGLDSLAAIELEGSIEAELGVTIPKQIFFKERLLMSDLLAAVENAKFTLVEAKEDIFDAPLDPVQVETYQTESNLNRVEFVSYVSGRSSSGSSFEQRELINRKLDDLQSELLDSDTLMDRLEEKLLDRILEAGLDGVSMRGFLEEKYDSSM